MTDIPDATFAPPSRTEGQPVESLGSLPPPNEPGGTQVAPVVGVEQPVEGTISPS